MRRMAKGALLQLVFENSQQVSGCKTVHFTDDIYFNLYCPLDDEKLLDS